MTYEQALNKGLEFCKGAGTDFTITEVIEVARLLYNYETDKPTQET